MPESDASKVRGLWPREQVTRAFERTILSVVQLLLMVVVALATLELAYLIWVSAPTIVLSVETMAQFQAKLLRGFAATMLVLIGLELIETIRAYGQDNRLRLELVLIVAIIALGRHIIQIDLEHLSGVSLLGIAALMVALTTGYFLIDRKGLAGRP